MRAINKLVLKKDNQSVSQIQRNGIRVEEYAKESRK